MYHVTGMNYNNLYIHNGFICRVRHKFVQMLKFHNKRSNTRENFGFREYDRGTLDIISMYKRMIQLSPVFHSTN